MRNIFEKLVNRSYIIPIAEEQREIIWECCQKLIAEITVEKFEQMCMSFLFGKADRIITTEIMEVAAELSVSVRIPQALNKNVAQYIISAVFESEEVDNETKAECSLALRNVLLSLKSEQIHVPYPEHLKNGVEFYDNHYISMARIKTPNAFKLTPDILQADSMDDIQNIDLKDCFEEIQYYCRIYARKQYEKQMDSIAQKCQDIENSFEKAFYIAEELSNQEWDYVDENPIGSIKRLLTVRSSKVAMQRIKDKVTNSDVYIQQESIHASSILLQYMSSNQDSLNFLDDVKLSPIEFAVALYYEFVFELKQEENHE